MSGGSPEKSGDESEDKCDRLESYGGNGVHSGQ